MKKLTLLEAAQKALDHAESWIHDQLDGTSHFDHAWKELAPVRGAIKRAEKAQKELEKLCREKHVFSSMEVTPTELNKEDK